MSIKSTKSLPKVSPEKDFRRELRKGQQSLYEALEWWDDPLLTVKHPGGYGKSLGMALAFRQMLKRGDCDRLLIVVANDTQRQQMLNDFRQDCEDVALFVDMPWKVTDEPATFKANRNNAVQVFVTTIQHVASCNRGMLNVVQALMKDYGRWMVAADEYHHYACEADWGNALQVVVDEAAFTLATSATPDRDGEPTIFGKPEEAVSVGYVEARKEGAVKHVRLKRYDYRVDYVNRDGDPVSFQSEELRDRLAVYKLKISDYEAKENLRYSAKYVLPIVHEPIRRLADARLRTGKPLQMLVRAMSCEHASTVCTQIKSIAGELTVDWIATKNRTPEENRKVKAAFCPPKDNKGNRPKPSLDVLVQVGMADEGFDSIMVAEIVDLSLARCEGAATRTKQFIKRGTRFVADDIDLFVNVGTDHPLASEGDIEEWIDSSREIETDPPDEPVERDTTEREWEFPDEDWFESQEELTDCELEEIIVDPRFKQVLTQEVGEVSDEKLMELFRRAMRMQAQEDQEVMTRDQMKSKLNALVGKLARKTVASCGEIERSSIGDMMKRINAKIVREFGKRDAMLKPDLMRAFRWLKAIYESVEEGNVPAWLQVK